MHFGDRLCEEIRHKDTRVVVGLDPWLELLPPFLNPNDSRDPTVLSQAVLRYGQLIIEAAADAAVAVKPQLAFYESLGSQGFAALEQTNRYAHEAGLLVICDGKRSDIGSTARAYARAYLERSPGDSWGIFCDALTVNPYLGSDGVRPFIETAAVQGKGVFILVKTSNPSSSEFQDLSVGGKPLYWEVARRVAEFALDTVGQSGYSHVGAVVGATYREAGADLRHWLPHCPLLVPGFGAQGGTAEDVMPLFDQAGQGALVSSSRGVASPASRCSNEKEFLSVIRQRVREMRDQVNRVAARVSTGVS